MNGSELLKFNWKDALKGLILAALTASLSSILTALQSGEINWQTVGTATLAATIAYILKTLGSDNQGNVLGIGSK